MCLWHFLSNVLQEHTEPLSSLGSIFPTHCPHSTLSNRSKPHCTAVVSSEKLPKQVSSIAAGSGRRFGAAVLRFSRVSRVLSSVFPPALSCSLTSEHKQEASRGADTSLQPYMRGHSLRIERQKVTQDLFVLTCHNTTTPMGDSVSYSLQVVYSIADIIQTQPAHRALNVISMKPHLLFQHSYDSFTLIYIHSCL